MKKRWKSNVLGFVVLIFLTEMGFGRIEQDDRLFRLHRDIVLLNLINGLYLTSGQIETIIDKVEEAEQIRKNHFDKMEKKKEEYENVLNDMKSILLKGGDFPKELERRHHQMKEMQRRLEDEMGEKLKRLELDIEGILTQNQLVVIGEYKPCTIPPQKGKIGQSVETAAKGVILMLIKVRRMPNDRYELMKEMPVNFHMDKVERHVGFQSPAERDEYFQHVLEVYNKARNLSDQDFMVQKGELARKILPEDVQKHKLRKNQLGKIGRFLLDPTLIPLLEERSKNS